jgi:hypothetical protein
METAMCGLRGDWSVTERGVFPSFPAAIHSLFRRNVIVAGLDLNQKQAPHLYVLDPEKWIPVFGSDHAQMKMTGRPSYG